MKQKKRRGTEKTQTLFTILGDLTINLDPKMNFELF